MASAYEYIQVKAIELSADDLTKLWLDAYGKDKTKLGGPEWIYRLYPGLTMLKSETRQTWLAYGNNDSLSALKYDMETKRFSK